MKLLVLGGGGFLGYHAVVEALAAGHEVTVFSRSGEPPVEGVDVVVGDRPGDLSGLRGREWDGFFDTFTDDEGGAPAVAATATLLSGSVRRARVEPDNDPLQARSVAKLAGERAVSEHFEGTALFPRVGIMVGPRSRRFTYWPVRLAGALSGRMPRTVVVPGDPSRPVQYSDARDVAAWTVAMLAAGPGGTFNTVGPGRPDTLQHVLDACLSAVGGQTGDVAFVPVRDEAALRDLLGYVEEEERPLWYPEDQIPQESIDSSAAIEQGLVFRSAYETAADTWTWARDTDTRDFTLAFVGWEQTILATRGTDSG